MAIGADDQVDGRPVEEPVPDLVVASGRPADLEDGPMPASSTNWLCRRAGRALDTLLEARNRGRGS